MNVLLNIVSSAKHLELIACFCCFNYYNSNIQITLKNQQYIYAMKQRQKQLQVVHYFQKE